jgi:fatty-acid desaturase
VLDDDSQSEQNYRGYDAQQLSVSGVLLVVVVMVVTTVLAVVFVVMFVVVMCHDSVFFLNSAAKVLQKFCNLVAISYLCPRKS